MGFFFFPYEKKKKKKKKKANPQVPAGSSLKRVRKFTELLLIVWIEKERVHRRKVETNRSIERNEKEKINDKKKKKKSREERK
jgi:hypothetical protein